MHSSVDEHLGSFHNLATVESAAINIRVHVPAMRKNEIMPFVATWMELVGIMLREISQTEKDRYHMFSLICGS